MQAFLEILLCVYPHNKNYVEFMIMWSFKLICLMIDKNHHLKTPHNIFCYYFPCTKEAVTYVHIGRAY